LGAWYTPPAIIQRIVAEVCDGFTPHTVLDPACGDGRFLDAFAGCQVTGVDIDPHTPYEHDDALRREWGEQRFDAVVGNPPFLNQLATATTRRGSSPFGGGPYADTAAEFLALALRLTRPGGRIGLVLPLSLLGTRDTAAVRAQLDAHAALRWMWWSPTRMFDANVLVWAGVWEVGATQGMVRRQVGADFDDLSAIPMPSHWSALISDHGDNESLPAEQTLASIATFTVGFRDQYYGLVGAVGDHVDGPPLITCGLIEPRRVLWGERTVTFARQRYAAPRVDLDKLTPQMRAWADRRLVPKLLIANQTSRVEVVHDEHGACLPSVPVISGLTAEPDLVMATLESDETLHFLRARAAGTGLSASALRLSPSLLASVPLR
jgi:SAM-dependent methyltransferase